jgi:hypothetical protein
MAARNVEAEPSSCAEEANDETVGAEAVRVFFMGVVIGRY